MELMMRNIKKIESHRALNRPPLRHRRAKVHGKAPGPVTQFSGITGYEQALDCTGIDLAMHWRALP